MKKLLIMGIIVLSFVGCGGYVPGNINPKDKPEVINTEKYTKVKENSFVDATLEPLSAFSIDVDSFFYGVMRDMILDRKILPDKSIINIEEMINYFPYTYAPASDGNPVESTIEVGNAPWNKSHKLIKIGIKAVEIDKTKAPPSNLVFLIDVSGSMADNYKLNYVKNSMKILTDNLRTQDRISIVTFSDDAKIVLPPTYGSEKEAIKAAIDGLYPGGATNGEKGLIMAYDVARESKLQDGNNRVVLSTDADFNQGITSDASMEKLIVERRDIGIYLTVLGYGSGNLKGSKLETMAKTGNGNAYYIDSAFEARKVLSKQLWGNLYTVAKDVKVQLDFNPLKVQKYKLIGYENNLLTNSEFNSDDVDAGELGSGQSCTAFYEIIPVEPSGSQNPDDYCSLNIRYKKPDASVNDNSILLTKKISEKTHFKDDTQLSSDFNFATAVIELGLILRESKDKGEAAFPKLIERARTNKGSDTEGYRADFINLAYEAQKLKQEAWEK